jgi:MFS family permease
MASLGVTALVIAGTFLASAGVEAALSPVAGRAADRRGAIVPIRCSLVGAVAISLLAPTLASAAVLIPVLIVGMPSFGTLFTPAMTLVSEGAQHQRLDQGLAFGLGNLAWAAGQAIAAATWSPTCCSRRCAWPPCSWSGSGAARGLNMRPGPGRNVLC